MLACPTASASAAPAEAKAAQPAEGEMVYPNRLPEAGLPPVSPRSARRLAWARGRLAVAFCTVDEPSLARLKSGYTPHKTPVFRTNTVQCVSPTFACNADVW
jgi:hypothetical protein